MISRARDPQAVMGDVPECADLDGELESLCLSKVF